MSPTEFKTAKSLALFYLNYDGHAPSSCNINDAELRVLPYDDSLMGGIKEGDEIEFEDKKLGKWNGMFKVDRIDSHSDEKQCKVIFYVHRATACPLPL